MATRSRPGRGGSRMVRRNYVPQRGEDDGSETSGAAARSAAAGATTAQGTSNNAAYGWCGATMCPSGGKTMDQRRRGQRLDRLRQVPPPRRGREHRSEAELALSAIAARVPEDARSKILKNQSCTIQDMREGGKGDEQKKALLYPDFVKTFSAFAIVHCQPETVTKEEVLGLFAHLHHCSSLASESGDFVRYHDGVREAKINAEGEACGRGLGRCGMRTGFWTSAYKHPEVLDKYISEEVAAGRLGGPFLIPPVPNFVCSPLGVVPKSTPEALLAKTDLKNAYRMVPVHPSFYPSLGMRWRNAFFHDKVVPMGMRSACQLYQKISDVLREGVRNMTNDGIFSVLDDFLFCGPASTMACKTNYDTFRRICQGINLPIQEDKSQPPTQQLCFLGLEIDTVGQRVRLPQDKLSKMKRSIVEFLRTPAPTLREWQKLGGLLNFAGLTELRAISKPRHVRSPSKLNLTLPISNAITWSAHGEKDYYEKLAALDDDINGVEFMFGKVWNMKGGIKALRFQNEEVPGDLRPVHVALLAWQPVTRELLLRLSHHMTRALARKDNPTASSSNHDALLTRVLKEAVVYVIPLWMSSSKSETLEGTCEAEFLDFEEAKTDSRLKALKEMVESEVVDAILALESGPQIQPPYSSRAAHRPDAGLKHCNASLRPEPKKLTVVEMIEAELNVTVYSNIVSCCSFPHPKVATGLYHEMLPSLLHFLSQLSLQGFAISVFEDAFYDLGRSLEDPSLVNVTVDGHLVSLFRGTTNVFRGAAPMGTHVVKVSQAGYRTKTERFEVHPLQVTNLTVYLTPVGSEWAVPSKGPAHRVSQGHDWLQEKSAEIQKQYSNNLEVKHLVNAQTLLWRVKSSSPPAASVNPDVQAKKPAVLLVGTSSSSAPAVVSLVETLLGQTSPILKQWLEISDLLVVPDVTGASGNANRTEDLCTGPLPLTKMPLPHLSDLCKELLSVPTVSSTVLVILLKTTREDVAMLEAIEESVFKLMGPPFMSSIQNPASDLTPCSEAQTHRRAQFPSASLEAEFSSLSVPVLSLTLALCCPSDLSATLSTHAQTLSVLIALANQRLRAVITTSAGQPIPETWLTVDHGATIDQRPGQHDITVLLPVGTHQVVAGGKRQETTTKKVAITAFAQTTVKISLKRLASGGQMTRPSYSFAAGSAILLTLVAIVAAYLFRPVITTSAGQPIPETWLTVDHGATIDQRPGQHDITVLLPVGTHQVVAGGKRQETTTKKVAITAFAQTTVKISLKRLASGGQMTRPSYSFAAGSAILLTLVAIVAAYLFRRRCTQQRRQRAKFTALGSRDPFFDADSDTDDEEDLLKTPFHKGAQSRGVAGDPVRVYCDSDSGAETSDEEIPVLVEQNKEYYQLRRSVGCRSLALTFSPPLPRGVLFPALVPELWDISKSASLFGLF
ncbi:unnamed protein product [Cyprideis torosa]|uniref:Uncharacterized protein n=2 Tax=Cyprideis torosa TaxID=163714 RepID=A0A7R8ZNS5_9CRUS|nr:unnamed protein product [Cyprideis torosa]CAG0897056.1 unnamed protein product [Cyprideis torosa]